VGKTLKDKEFVSRAGAKLDYAFDRFDISVEGKVCVDLGCSTGGFVDCLLQRGAERVYAVDTAYGVLDWNLRNDDRVEVLERTNALHLDAVEIAETVDFISIDVGWTPQKLVLPKARQFLKRDGDIVSLVKPHYELKHHPLPEKFIDKGKICEDKVEEVVDYVKEDLKQKGFQIKDRVRSPLKGKKGGNIEYLFWIKTA
jgi:23S rRNA (cytidine1920-2'-O)/16S rRNA (cytidine1409-2'-O)-methyltransferase